MVFLLISYKSVIIRLDDKCNVHQSLHLDIDITFLFLVNNNTYYLQGIIYNETK